MRSLCIILLLLGTATAASGQDAIKWVFTDYPPANFQTQDGKFSGFLHDIVIDVFNRQLNTRVDIEIYPWKRCQAMVRDGSADIMVTIPTAERLTYAVTHGRPIWVKRRIIYTYNRHSELDKIARLSGLPAIRDSGFKVVSYLGNGWVEKEVSGSGIPVVFATTVNGMYRMLTAERGDLIIEERSLAAPRISQIGLSDRIIETSGIGHESGFYILIGKRSAYASQIQRIDRIIEDLRRSGRLDQITQAYTQNTGG